MTSEEQNKLIDIIEGYFILTDTKYTKGDFDEGFESKYDSYILVENPNREIIIRYDNSIFQKKYRCIDFNIVNATTATTDTAYTYAYAYKFILNNLYKSDFESNFIKLK